jgi:hypothetical protein
MSDGVHLLVPFAACLAEGSREALRGLKLPHLEKLLARLALVHSDEGDERQLSMPHERALAREYGLASPDGQIPWAAWQVAQSGRDTRFAPWAWITPCHWRVGTGLVAMDHPQELQLDPRESQELLAAMQPYFEQDGIRVEYDAPTLWLARGELFRDLPTASLDRVVGRFVDPWMPRGGRAGPLRRLQQEMQMLLYTHPVNDERSRGGQQPVNSFWVSGTGVLPPTARPAAPAGLQITHYLRDAALRGDWRAWAGAWQQLDATECTRLATVLDKGEPVTLTLCGERSARTWTAERAGPWRRMTSLFNRPVAAQVLEPL